MLDVGCGMGRHAYLLSQKGYSCEGVEPHPKMVEYSRQHYSGVTYKTGHMQNINYKNKFDAVMCIFSSIVFNKSNEEAVKTFRNFNRALKKKGVIVIETYNCISCLVHNSFRRWFVDLERENNRKIIMHEWINPNHQSYVSERKYYQLSDNKKLGEFTKESRMFFPLELKFFLESAGFEVLTMLSANSLNKMTFKDTTLDKKRLLVVAIKKKN